MAIMVPSLQTKSGMKKCSKCLASKPFSEFHKRKNRKTGINSSCKECKNTQTKNWAKKNPEKKKLLRKKYYNSIKGKLTRKIYNGLESTKLARRQYDKTEKRILDHRKYDKKRNNSKKRKLARLLYRTSDHGRKIQNYRQIERKKEDVQYRISGNLRSRLWKALKRNSKKGSAVRDLGCSIEFLVQYLESQFKEDWSWDNYGIIWEIDHIIPLKHKNIDLNKREDFLKVCHYTNLRPYNKIKNISEGNRR